MSIGHIQVKQYANLNGKYIYIHAVVTMPHGTFLKSVVLGKNKLIPINDKDIVELID